MGSRLLPSALAAGALLAYGLHAGRGASYLVLLAIPAAAAAAFVAVADMMEGKDGSLPRAVGATLGLVLIVLGAAAGSNAPVGAAVPALALSTLVGALAVYSLSLVGWLLEPLRPRRRAPVPVRAARVPAESRAAEAA